jgi:pyruvate formate lyase activating enzyme
MKIGGFQKTSLIDYPGKISSIIFTQGCNFRCGFCYNSSLVIPELFTKPIEEKKIFEFLKKRKDKIEGIVITGGEPTIHDDLPEFIKKIKEMGFLVKLDTNGSSPEMIKKLLREKLLDYIAMDIKAPPNKYEIVTGIKINLEMIRESIKIIMSSSIDYEFRTTVVKSLFSEKDFEDIGKLIRGCKLYVLQSFMPTETVIDKKYMNEKPPEKEFMEKIKRIMEKYVKKCIIRGI